MDARVSQSEIPKVYDSLSKTYDIWGKLAESKARNRAIELAVAFPLRSNPGTNKVKKEWALEVHETILSHLNEWHGSAKW